MEDRYLYRAKRADNGEWEIGSLVILPNGKYEIANSCVNPPDSDPMWKACVITHIVDPSTVCQCTGLKDKNGNLIWENDILNPFSDLKGIVKFGVRSFGYEFGFYIEWISKACYRKDFLYWVKQENLGIIGNIFDNPDKCN